MRKVAVVTQERVVGGFGRRSSATHQSWYFRSIAPLFSAALVSKCSPPLLSGVEESGATMKEGERYVLTTGKASVILGALSLLLAGGKSEGNLTPGSRERLETFVSERCNRLILDLRRAKELPGAVAPKVRNLRVSHVGPVLVVTGQVTSFEILHEIESLCHSRSLLGRFASGLRAFAHLSF